MTRLRAIESFMQETPCLVCLEIDYQISLNCVLLDQFHDHAAECNNCGQNILIAEITVGQKVLFSQDGKLAQRQGSLIYQENSLLVEYIYDIGTKDYLFFAQYLNDEHSMKINTKGIQYLNIVRKSEEVLPEVLPVQSNSEDSLKFFKGVMFGVPIALFMWWLIWKVFN
jgi:hypothetical protein